MLWNAKNGEVILGDTEMSYVSFGHGEKAFILLPGLSDGLITVKGKALLLARPYRCFFDRYTVYMFSRKNKMPDDYSIRDMADDQAKAMEILGLKKASVMGVSQGGMIAQYLAIDHAEMIEKLVIAVSAPYANDTIRACVSNWIDLANGGQYKQLMVDMNDRAYSKEYLKKYQKFYPVIGTAMKRLCYDRFFINAKAILDFNTLDNLAKIGCPTFIIGGTEDKVVGSDAVYEMKERITNSELYLYEGLGHAAFEEATDFNERVFRFLETMQ
ncbi:MAG: alpha/beta hydrolase [Lachnospiraceae bacterium]|nr:alpha/beta hydrolase [Lachnospiraceae bacterium]